MAYMINLKNKRVNFTFQNLYKLTSKKRTHSLYPKHELLIFKFNLYPQL